MTDIPDFLREVDRDEVQPTSGEALETVYELIEEMQTLDAETRALEQQLEEKKARLTKIRHRELPRLMPEIGTDRLGLPDSDSDVVLEPYYHANIKSEWDSSRKDEGFDNLAAAGYGAVVRVKVVMEFDRDEYEDAMELRDYLLESRWANQHPPQLERTVPWNTLTSCVREEHKKSVEEQRPMRIDLDKVGATIGRVAKIKKRKK